MLVDIRIYCESCNTVVKTIALDVPFENLNTAIRNNSLVTWLEQNSNHQHAIDGSPLLALIQLSGQEEVFSIRLDNGIKDNYKPTNPI